MEIRLDKETFKALASTTRVDVLKLLARRRHMQSELAAELNLSVPTVKEHLFALERAGLVERHEEGRKWKYYSLTKKGEGVLHPEEMKIWIVLSMLVFSVIGGFVTYFRTMVPQEVMMEAKMAMTAPGLESMDALAATAPVQPMNVWLIVFSISAVVFAVLFVYLLVKTAQYKKQLGNHLTKK
ncbi:MAG TPA: winged helix-turn-helix domain-containing protein [Candidatus Nanoarchaeia archaeon]|nr:winged helix-turn-helix domain-containing protein [Candidatus Nanoarchaeia archaeon]